MLFRNGQRILSKSLIQSILGILVQQIQHSCSVFQSQPNNSVVRTLVPRAGYVLTVEAVKLPYIYRGAIIFIDLFRYNVELIGSLE